MVALDCVVAVLIDVARTVTVAAELLVIVADRRTTADENAGIAMLVILVTVAPDVSSNCAVTGPDVPRIARLN